MTHPNRESVAKVADDIRTALQLAVEQPVRDDTRRSALPTFPSKRSPNRFRPRM